MEILFRSSASFEEDMARLSLAERNLVAGRINRLCPEYLCNRESFCSLIESPEDPKLAGGLCSSLSLLPLGDGRAAILTLDDDPIFDQLIITLIRLAPVSDSARIYREVLHDLRSALEQGCVPEAGG